YNPRSARRANQLAAARTILLVRRPADTPDALPPYLGRQDESLVLTTLQALKPEAVDMLTIVLVGSSQTRLIPGREPRIYTPRGYVHARNESAIEDAKRCPPDTSDGRGDRAMTVHFIGAGPGAA